MVTRRTFLGAISVPAVSAVVAARLATTLSVAKAARVVEALEGADRCDAGAEELARDERFWFPITQAFTVDRSIVNLNNGGVSPSPLVVQASMKRYLDYSNTAPAYVLWRILEPQREGVRDQLARQFGCDKDEIALTRNASESLQTVQFGLDLRAGDEVLTTNQDYPRMIATFKQRARREGIVLKQFSIPTPAEDPDRIVALFRDNITPRTRLILMSHIIFLTGQVLPVAQVVAMARTRGIPVIVDGAHALAHVDFRLADLNCDYYGSSLHKWLFAPHGTGLLYVRRNKVRDLWPLMAAEEKMDDDIRKFEEIGTHPAANYLAIADALAFHQGIGGKRKEARLVYLRDYWAKRLLGNPRVRLHTSLRPGLAGGIATVHVEGLSANDLNQWLWDKHRIFTVGIVHEEFEGLRVSPSVYTTLEELDRFCDAVELAMRKGISN